MPSLHVQEVQRRCGQEAAVNQFFSDLESLEFPDATLREVNLDRAEAATVWRASRPNPGPNEKNPYEGRVNFSLGSGSLEGEGKVASQTCNLGRACAFLTEGKRWFNWLSAEGTLNETIVTELFERAKWRRVTLDGTRSFTIMFPFFALSGAVHLPDVAFMFAGDDPLGIRGRARFMYTRQVTLATLAVAFLACLFPLLHAACVGSATGHPSSGPQTCVKQTVNTTPTGSSCRTLRSASDPPMQRTVQIFCHARFSSL